MCLVQNNLMVLEKQKTKTTTKQKPQQQQQKQKKKHKQRNYLSDRLALGLLMKKNWAQKCGRELQIEFAR